MQWLKRIVCLLIRWVTVAFAALLSLRKQAYRGAPTAATGVRIALKALACTSLLLRLSQPAAAASRLLDCPLRDVSTIGATLVCRRVREQCLRHPLLHQRPARERDPAALCRNAADFWSRAGLQLPVRRAHLGVRATPGKARPETGWS